MSKVYILRHGETDYNVQCRYQGQSDIPLNEYWRRQVQVAKAHIKNLIFEVIYVSPTQRTNETAQIINVRNVPLIQERAFLERNMWVYEWLTRQEAQEKYPNLWKLNITRQYKSAPTNWETIKDVEERVFSKLNELKSTITNDILIVTHAFTSKVIHKYFNPNISDENFFAFVIENSEIQTYEF
jgi:probable phosphoglycerate mutase